MFGRSQVHEELTVIKSQRETNSLHSSLASCQASNLYFENSAVIPNSGIRVLVTPQHSRTQLYKHLQPTDSKVEQPCQLQIISMIRLSRMNHKNIRYFNIPKQMRQNPISIYQLNDFLKRCVKIGIESYFPTDLHFKTYKIQVRGLKGRNQTVIHTANIEQPQIIKRGKEFFLIKSETMEIHRFKQTCKSPPFSGPSEIL